MKWILKALTLFFSLCMINEALASPDTHRISFWGFTGSESQALLDAFIPIVQQSTYCLYGDTQGGIGIEGAWYASLGGGYRQLISNSQIYGGYLFLDRNESKHNNTFWILSPGIEMILSQSDFRLNGYIPVSEQQRRGPSFFPSGENACGIQGDCSFIEFKGHQQYEHRFFLFEEVGPGLDAEMGYTLPIINNTAIHVGGYHFKLKDTSDMKGIEGRIEIPVNPHWAIAASASYDNQHHGAFVAGLRFNIDNNQKPLTNIQHHFFDPIPRNLGSLHTGSGFPIVRDIKDEGLFLRRDNIYFFSSTGGISFNGTSRSGTFEHPLAADQLSQTVVDGIDRIAQDANLYFNTGTYTIQPGANSSISLHDGQSLFGREADFKCTAMGNERPQLLGEIDLLEGNNNLDSIIITNNMASPSGGVITALDIENAPNIHICNTEINASSVVLGTNTSNTVTAIAITNSSVIIENSVIRALASVTGDNDNLNETFGIFVTNNTNLYLSSSTLEASSFVAQNNNLNNLNHANGIVLSNNNNATILSSLISAQAIVGGDNQHGNQAFTFALDSSNNLIVGESMINTLATATNNNSVNVSENFNLESNNNISIFKSTLNSEALVSNINNLFNLNYNFNVGRENNVTIIQSNVNSKVSAGTNNHGNQSTNISLFESSNIFNITESSFNTNAITGSNAVLELNQAVAISDSDINNLVTISNSNFNVNATILGNNAGANIAQGFFVSNSSVLNIYNSTVNVLAEVLGINTGANIAQGTMGPGQVNSQGTQFNVIANP